MIVFEYFFDKMDLFGPLMDEMAAREALQNEEVYSHQFKFMSVH